MSCPSGYFAVGGGGYSTDLGADMAFTRPVGGGTSAPATGWQAAWYVFRGGSYTAYAVCSR
ncbi:MAG: hypothetical protein V9F82_12630 [Dermatophilaceae bacterium]